MADTRKTLKGRVRNAPRIEPTYGTRRQRQDRKRSEAVERQRLHDAAMEKYNDR